MNHDINPGNVQWIITTISETPVSGMQAAKGYNMGGDGN